MFKPLEGTKHAKTARMFCFGLFRGGRGGGLKISGETFVRICGGTESRETFPLSVMLDLFAFCFRVIELMPEVKQCRGSSLLYSAL